MLPSLNWPWNLTYKGWWTHRNHITSTACVLYQSVFYQCVLYQCLLYHGFKSKFLNEVWQLRIPVKRSQTIWKGSFKKFFFVTHLLATSKSKGKCMNYKDELVYKNITYICKHGGVYKSHKWLPFLA